MPERRVAARIRVNLPVRYSSRTLSVDGRAANLSRSGLFLCSEFLDDVGEAAEVILELPSQEPVQVKGQVVRVDAAPASAGMGIRFDQLGPEVRRTLANFMIQRSYSTL